MGGCEEQKERGEKGKWVGKQSGKGGVSWGCVRERRSREGRNGWRMDVLAREVMKNLGWRERERERKRWSARVERDAL